MRILCPVCTSHLVEAPFTTFEETTVTVPVCGNCAEKGMVSTTIKKSALLDLAHDEVRIRHTSGNLEFSGWKI